MGVFRQLEALATGDSLPLVEVLDALPWNADGLLPAIAQQHDSGEVLMLAWMNRNALDETLRTGRVCYWSRSRQALWRKGRPAILAGAIASTTGSTGIGWWSTRRCKSIRRSYTGNDRDPADTGIR